MKKENIVFWVFIGIVLVVAGLYYVFVHDKPTGSEEYHIHADFKVYVRGEFYNFSDEKFMSSGEVYKHKYVHLHDGESDVIHFHDVFVTLKDFFESLNMSLNTSCFVLDNGNEFCSDEANVLEMYVNEELVEITPGFAPRDLDRILIYHGEKRNVDNLFQEVTDKACIQSGKCPERGEPSDESSCGPDSCSVSLI